MNAPFTARRRPTLLEKFDDDALAVLPSTAAAAAGRLLLLLPGLDVLLLGDEVPQVLHRLLVAHAGRRRRR